MRNRCLSPMDEKEDYAQQVSLTLGREGGLCATGVSRLRREDYAQQVSLTLGEGALCAEVPLSLRRELYAQRFLSA